MEELSMELPNQIISRAEETRCGQNRDQRKVRLYDGPASFVDAEVLPDGSVMVDSYDVSEGHIQFCGRDDLELYATVKPESKDQLLMALLTDRFSGDPCAFHKFEEYLKAKTIPYEFVDW